MWDYSLAAQAVCDYHLPARGCRRSAAPATNFSAHRGLTPTAKNQMSPLRGSARRLKSARDEKRELADAGLKAGSTTL